jgi:hypothetical protein
MMMQPLKQTPPCTRVLVLVVVVVLAVGAVVQGAVVVVAVLGNSQLVSPSITVEQKCNKDFFFYNCIFGIGGLEAFLEQNCR